MDRITVIIVNWNGKKILSKCLEGLKKQVYQDFSTILVDNGSIDGSIEFVKQCYPEVKIMALPENIGFAAANNVALRNIQTEFVALINNDGVAQPQWLDVMIKALDAHPKAGFAASKMVYYDKPDIIDRAGDAYTIAGAGSLRGRGAPAQSYNQIKWIFGACAGAALYRMHMLNDIGLFDEDFFILYEDVDLSFRAQLNGYRCLYLPQALVYHMATRSIGYDTAKSVYFGHRNMEWTYIHNMPNKLIIRTIIPHLLYIIFAFIFFALKGHGRVYLKAKKDALLGLGTAIKKRKMVQAHCKVNHRYISQLFDPEYFFSRYIHRLKK